MIRLMEENIVRVLTLVQRSFYLGFPCRMFLLRGSFRAYSNKKDNSNQGVTILTTQRSNERFRIPKESMPYVAQFLILSDSETLLHCYSQKFRFFREKA